MGEFKEALDVGCAEGLISLELARAGVPRVYGVEIVREHVDTARRLASKHPQCVFVVGDADQFNPQPNAYDAVLALALLHKLRDPSAACRRLATATRKLFVIRLPPGDGKIVDDRSSRVVHDIPRVMAECGFNVKSMPQGPRGEWMAYYERM